MFGLAIGVSAASAAAGAVSSPRHAAVAATRLMRMEAPTRADGETGGCGTTAACGSRTRASSSSSAPPPPASRTGRASGSQPDQVVSSDRLRAVVGLGERDQRASGDAFEVLDLIVAKRMRRRLTTVIDSTGLDAERRAAWRALAERHGVPAYAVRVRRARERRARAQPRARGPGAEQGRQRASCARRPAPPTRSPARASPASTAPARSRSCRPRSRRALDAAARQQEDPVPLEFGLQIARFGWPGRPAATAAHARRRRARGGGRRLHEPLGDGPLRPDPAGRARVGGHAREPHDARLPRRRDRADPARHARHRHHATATSRTWRRSSRRSTCSPAAARCAGSAPAGSSASTGSTAGTSRRSPSASRGSRTRSSCCR